ncbi:hypothetical protein [Pedobacter antarcticus]|uniref:hypothetical protein n=1 Tax=Pedobacter antarcticus TaxID=34086 RepID=UPI00087F2BDA|nr:hypothetical protein [Pedobacter antarcticus]SDM14739.1 hypothetical protein SAMN04488084_10467 [Pedobacter antarcticus]
MLKKISTTAAIILLFQIQAFSQIQDCAKELGDVLRKIPYQISGLAYFRQLPQQEQSFLLSIMVSVDNRGSIEVTYYNRSKISDEVLRYKQITKSIKKDSSGLLRNQINSRFLLPVWVKKAEADKHEIEVGTGFTAHFASIIPTGFYAGENIEAVVLNPVILDIDGSTL